MWFAILRNHPELQVASDGNQVQLERNQNLKNLLAPNTTHTLEHFLSELVELNSHVSGGIGLDGKFYLYSNHDMLLRSSIDIRSPEGTLPLPYGIPANMKLEPGSYFVLKTSSKFKLTKKSIQKQLEDQMNIDRNFQVVSYFQYRVVLLGLDVYTEIIPIENYIGAAPPAGGKKPPPKKDAAPTEIKPKRLVKPRLVILDIFADDFDKLQYCRIDRIHDFYLEPLIEFDTLNLQNVLSTNTCLDISEDHTLLSLVWNDSATGALCQVFDLTAPREKHVTTIANSLNELEEEAEGGTGGNEEEGVNGSKQDDAANDAMLLPSLVTQWKVANSLRKTITVQKLLILTPLTKDGNLTSVETKKPSDPAPTPPADGGIPAVPSVPHRPDFYTQIRLLPILTGQLWVPILQLKNKPKEPVEPVNPKDAKKPPAKGKEEVSPPPVMTFPCEVYELLRWSLPSSITAFHFLVNERSCREMILLGYVNGMITLWNTYYNSIIQVIGHHLTAISHIASMPYYSEVPTTGSTNVSSLASLGLHYLIVGSVDGCASLFTNHPSQTAPTPSTTSNKISGQGLIAGERGIASKPLVSLQRPNRIATTKSNSFNIPTFQLIQYRNDYFQLECIVSMQCISPECFMIQYGNHNLVFYHLDTFQIIGSIAITERIDFETVESIFINLMNIPLHDFIFLDPKPLELLIPPDDPSLLTLTPEERQEIVLDAVERQKLQIKEDCLSGISIESARLNQKDCKHMILEGISLQTFRVFTSLSRCNDASKLATIMMQNQSPAQSAHAYQNHVLLVHSFRGKRSCIMQYLLPNQPPQPQTASVPTAPGFSATASITHSKDPSLTGTVNKPTKLRNLTSGTAPRPMKLTEERLLAHEQSFIQSNAPRSPTHRAALPQLPPPSLQSTLQYHPENLVKQELLLKKKQRLQPFNKPPSLTKKLNTLANLCGGATN